jgi:outer membrane protein assembly factor BamB
MVDAFPFQQRNLISLGIGAGSMALTFLWWVLLSRSRWRLRLGVVLGVALLGAAGVSLFRVVGVTGDLIPVLGYRWTSKPSSPEPVSAAVSSAAASMAEKDRVRTPYPQFLGPHRDGVLPGPKLAMNWETNPPRVLWRRPIGAGWAGFAVAGGMALTLEQHGDHEEVASYDAETGEPRWRYSYPARYATPIGGEGPRTTPTVVSNRVYTLGGTGLLHCLDLATGSNWWKVDIIAEAQASVLEWGMAGSPLVENGAVVVCAGGSSGKSVLAFDALSGAKLWAGGDSHTSYGSPRLATLAGVPQILVFNHRSIASHDPQTGAVLWEQPWGIGYPLVAMPVLVGTNRVLYSAGYNVGAELFEIEKSAAGLKPRSVWRSNRLKAKFSNPVLKDGYVYGLDDGILACIDVRDGALKWKSGRYGHGQGLLVGARYLLMSEHGELVLLEPTPEGPGRVETFTLFSGKTWNPISLGGDHLYARTDSEAVCVQLPIETVATR